MNDDESIQSVSQRLCFCPIQQHDTHYCVLKQSQQSFVNHPNCKEEGVSLLFVETNPNLPHHLIHQPCCLTPWFHCPHCPAPPLIEILPKDKNIVYS